MKTKGFSAGSLLAWFRVTKKDQASNQSRLTTLRYGPFQAVIITAGAFLLATVGTSILLSVYPLTQGWSEAQTNEWINNSAIAQFFIFFSSSLIMAGSAFGILRYLKQSLAQIGVTGPNIRNLLQGAVTFVPYFMALIVTVAFVGTFIPSVDINQEQEIFTAPVAGPNLILVFIALVVLPPLVEEFMFRGVLFTGLRKKLSFVWTTVIVSVVFGSLHLSASSDGPLWIAAIDTALLSFFLCYLRERTGTIWAGVGLHFVKNFIAFVTLFVIT
jgi:membrane protease YdiL (CAAX protease family)